MKRRSFFKKLGISGLVASVAPQIIQEVKAEEPNGGYVVPSGFIDEMHLYPIPPDNRVRLYINGEEISRKTFTAKGNKITFK